MCNLLPNPLAVHYSSALCDPKKETPDQADLLIGKYNVGEIVMAYKQATGTHQKNTEQNAHYLLTIPTSGTKRASGAIFLPLRKQQPLLDHPKQIIQRLSQCWVSKHRFAQHRVGHLAHHGYLQHCHDLAALDAKDCTT